MSPAKNPTTKPALIEMAERRQRLVAQIQAQRTDLAQALAPWRQPLARVDRGLAVVRVVRRYSLWIVGGAALLAALRPARVTVWLQRGWVAWRLLRRLRGG